MQFFLIWARSWQYLLGPLLRSAGPSLWGREALLASCPRTLAAPGPGTAPLEEEGTWPPSAEALVIWGGRGVDLTSCLNLALVEFFNRGYDPPSSLFQAFFTYSSNQFLALVLILLFTLERWT